MGVLRKWQYVVGVEFVTARTTLPTSEVITQEDRGTPFSILDALPNSLIL